MNEQSQPLALRLTRQAHDTFVGRDDELGTLRTLLAPDGPLIVYLYGTPGVGKSTLLATFADDARAAGATALVLDCRLVEPTERGFLAELERLTGANIETLADAAAMIERSDGAVVIGLDHYETFHLLDTWLRQTFLPAAPGNVRLVMTSRRPPVPRWLTSPHWYGLFRALALKPLGREASLRLLATSGLDQAAAEAVATVTHGNPLALKLAASATLAGGPLTFQDTAVQEVMQQLTTLFLADVEDPATRDAVRYASVARRITRSLLRALSFEDETLFDRMQQLPFVDSVRDGLRIHDAVREAVSRTLRANDPERHLDCRRRTWRLLRDEYRSAPRADVWRYTADMLFLIENAVWREAFFPSGHNELAIEPAQSDDLAAIRAIAVAHEGPAAVAALESWLAEQLAGVRVVRDGAGQVAGFYCMCERSQLSDAVRAADPVVDAWCDHLLDDPAPAGSKILFIRRWLMRDQGEAPSAGQAACWLDIKRTYMELRPQLRRAYLTVTDLPTYAPVARQLGFRHLADSSAELDGLLYHATVLDFGPASVDGWITGLVGAELGVGDRSPLDRERRALMIEGREIALTKLEYLLAEHLEDRPGATVTRDELLDEVWGHADGAGSSNVVDAVVKSLRRKLEAESDRVETVRGHGYRWRVS